MTDPQKDPWRARGEIAEKLRKLAFDIDNVSINEDMFNFGDFDKLYRTRVIRSLKTMNKMTDSFSVVIENLLKWSKK